MKIKRLFHDGLARDTFVLFLMLNFFNFLNLIYHFVVARALTKSEYGVLIALFSIIYIFGVPAEAIQNISSRMTSKFNVKKEDGKIKYFMKKSISQATKISCLLFVLLIGVALLLSYFLKINIWLLLLTNGMIFLFTLSPIPRGVLQGKGRFFALGSSFVLESVLRLVLSVVFVLIGWKVFGAVFGVFLGLVFGFLIALYFTRDIFKQKEERVELAGVKTFSLPFFITTFVIFAMLSLDTLLARYFFDPETAGNYAVIATLGKIIFLGTVSISKTMFSAVAERFEENKDYKNAFKKSFVILVCISIVALVFYLLLPGLIVFLTYGNQYSDSGVADLLVYSGIALTFLAFSNITLMYGLSLNRITKPYWLFLFVIVQALLLFTLHSSLREYLIAVIISNITMFIGSIFIVKR